MRRAILLLLFFLGGLLTFYAGIIAGGGGVLRTMPGDGKVVDAKTVAAAAGLRPVANSRSLVRMGSEARSALALEAQAADRRAMQAMSKTCTFPEQHSQSSRPGVPCIPPAEVWPYEKNTPWRTQLGERIVRAVIPDISAAECGGFELFGDQAWCKKAMAGKDDGVIGLSFGIEQRDLWSEYVSQKFHLKTRLFDCFIPPEQSPPIARTAQTGNCPSNFNYHCYSEPYESYRVCLGPEEGTFGGRKFNTLKNAISDAGPLSLHVKIDVEGSEWKVLRELLSSEEDQGKIRTIDMEVHFGYRGGSDSDAEWEATPEKERLEKEVKVLEDLNRRFRVTGTTLEVYREGWRPVQDCPQQQCFEPIVHTAGGFSPQQFAVSYVNRDLIGSGPGVPLAPSRQSPIGAVAPAAGSAPAPAQEEVLPEPEPEESQGDAVAAVEPQPAEGRTAKYGFYLHVFADPAAVFHQVRQLKKFFPSSPIYVMSDGGQDFSGFCEAEGCTFVLCPPANDRWHPWPFFRRLYDAALELNVEYVIMLEPDNTVHGPITRTPTADAGGLYVKDRSFGLTPYVEGLAAQRVPGFKWTRRAMQAGLAGGSYFRTEAILDAFSDDVMAQIDWNYVGEQATKEVFSSDFAMQYALAARGYRIEPWDETAQMDRHKDIPLTGPQDAAFRHYCSCYPGGKPTYNLRLRDEDRKFVKSAPPKYNSLNSVCQICYNLERYKANWGSARCTNHLSFNYSRLIMSRYHSDLKQKCDLPWMCPL